jgi:hypothetical protein
LVFPLITISSSSSEILFAYKVSSQSLFMVRLKAARWRNLRLKVRCIIYSSLILCNKGILRDKNKNNHKVNQCPRTNKGIVADGIWHMVGILGFMVVSWRTAPSSAIVWTQMRASPKDLWDPIVKLFLWNPRI